MSYNFIYTINNSSTYSSDYNTKDECNAAQSAFITSDPIKKSVAPIKIQGCADYNSEDGTPGIIYNFNTNQIADKKIDLIPGATNYTMLEPINGMKSIDVVPGTFSTYLQSSFNVILGVMLVISVFRVMYGGAIFMTTDIVINKTKAKEIIINSLRGVFLAMITWGVLFFINPDTVNNNLGRIVLESGGKVVSGVGTGVGIVVDTIGGITGPSSGTTVSNATDLFAKVLSDENDKRQKLVAGGIDINHGPCTNVGSTGCTDVGLINDTIINKLIALEGDCKKYNPSCEVIVTGGTEWWAHGGAVQDPNLNKSKHVPGKYSSQAIDLSLDTVLVNFLSKNGVKQGEDGYCYQRYLYNGSVYCDEINKARHFHINY